MTQYAVVGVIGTCAHFAILLSLALYLGSTLSSTLGAIAGCVVNYMLVRALVFKTNAPHYDVFPKFGVVAIACVSVNAVVFHLSSYRFSIVVSQFMASAVVLVTGYALNRNWTFHGR
ncbi:MAG: GtrA family protein [Pseudomonadota bacterium]